VEKKTDKPRKPTAFFNGKKGSRVGEGGQPKMWGVQNVLEHCRSRFSILGKDSEERAKSAPSLKRAYENRRKAGGNH